MIQVNELRIGNFVKCKTSNDDAIYQILALDGLHLKIYLNEPRNKWHTEDLIKPIKLTEEILLKCGFEKIKGGNGDYQITLQKGKGLGHSDYILFVDFGLDNNTNIITISLVSEESEWLETKSKYLHQLQNLYFYLCGEELTINLSNN